jgi:hypothetical protein
MSAEETFKMATRESKAASDLGEQASALAEQLRRIAGTIEGTAEAWLDRPSLTRRLTQIRDAPHGCWQCRVGRIPKLRTAAAARMRRKSLA